MVATLRPDGAYEQIVQATAPQERFAEMKALFQQMLGTHTPHPALPK